MKRQTRAGKMAFHLMIGDPPHRNHHKLFHVWYRIITKQLGNQ
jgi:hypothetical protein